jgi:hypothetical protein
VKTAAELIEEARGYGLDVEAERCDLLVLRADVMMLRALDEPLRGGGVERLNDGHPLPASLAEAEALAPGGSNDA